jgi:hypothetical protein
LEKAFAFTSLFGRPPFIRLYGFFKTSHGTFVDARITPLEVTNLLLGPIPGFIGVTWKAGGSSDEWQVVPCSALPERDRPLAYDGQYTIVLGASPTPEGSPL